MYITVTVIAFSSCYSIFDEALLFICIFCLFTTFLLQFDAEFRRFSVDVSNSSLLKYLEFHTLLETLHALTATPFIITYIDPVHGDSLPINNDDNFTKALTTARPLLRVMVQKRGKLCLLPEQVKYPWNNSVCQVNCSFDSGYILS